MKNRRVKREKIWKVEILSKSFQKRKEVERNILRDHIVISIFVREWYWVKHNHCQYFIMWSESCEPYYDSHTWKIISLIIIESSWSQREIKTWYLERLILVLLERINSWYQETLMLVVTWRGWYLCKSKVLLVNFLSMWLKRLYIALGEGEPV